MAFAVKDRVKEISSTTGTGSLTLGGAVTGYQSFNAALSNGDTTYYVIENPNTSEWETGLGTFTSPSTLARTTVLSSSTGSAVSFTAGAKNVFISLPATKFPAANTTIVGTDATQTLTNKSISGASNTITNVSLTTGVTGTLPVANGGTGVTSSTGSGSVVLSASPTLTGTLTAAAVSLSGQLTSTLANNTATGGGQIYLNGATGNRIDWVALGAAPPAFTTRSAGTKLVLYPSLDASNADFAFGVESGTLWSSVSGTGAAFKWYGGTTLAATLSGAGALTLVGGLSATTINGNTFTAGTGTLTLAAGKTLTSNNNLTLTAIDGSTLSIGTGGALKTAAFVATGNSGATIPLLSGNNTWSGTNAFTSTLTYGGKTLASSATGDAGSSMVLSASPTLTGTPTAPTAANTDNSTKVATTAFIAQANPGMLYGLTLSTAGSSATFGISAGRAVDTTVTSRMILPSAYTKTTSAWAVGSGNGCLDFGTIGNSLWYHEYLIQKTDLTTVDVLCSLANGNSGTSTVTIATPGVVTFADHGFQIGSPVVFTTTGALPTGIVASTTYYVISAGFTTSAFQIAATQGGAEINTSGTQSGVHTVASRPTMPATYTLYRRIGSMKTNGSAQWNSFVQNDDQFCMLEVPDFSFSGTSAMTLRTLSVPIGVILSPTIRGYSSSVNNTGTTMRVAPASNSAIYRTLGGSSANGNANGIYLEGGTEVGPPTNTSGQIYVEVTQNSNGGYLYTNGWIDRRGRDG